MISLSHVANPFAYAGDAFKMMARLQCETFSLFSQRAQAYVDLPKAMAQCHSPEDMLTEQVRFLQVAQRQYAECYQKVLSALPSVREAELAAVAALPAQRRDYMVVLDQKADTARAAAGETQAAVPASRPTIRVRRSA